MWEEFKEFALKGSVFDMAIGIIIGAAFSKIVNSLVDDIIMPPVGLIIGKIKFTNLFISLTGRHYKSLAAAKAAGAPTLNYGVFLANVLNFFIVAVILFFVVRELNSLRKGNHDTEVIKTTACPHCKEQVNAQATRCPHCTADLTPPIRIRVK